MRNFTKCFLSCFVFLSDLCDTSLTLNYTLFKKHSECHRKCKWKDIKVIKKYEKMRWQFWFSFYLGPISSPWHACPYYIFWDGCSIKINLFVKETFFIILWTFVGKNKHVFVLAMWSFLVQKHVIYLLFLRFFHCQYDTDDYANSSQPFIKTSNKRCFVDRLTPPIYGWYRTQREMWEG